MISSILTRGPKGLRELSRTLTYSLCKGSGNSGRCSSQKRVPPNLYEVSFMATLYAVRRRGRARLDPPTPLAQRI